MIDVDAGHGGGQLLRTALSISALTKKTLHMTNIRKDRPKAGLAAQHVMCVNALQTITGGTTSGATLGSTELKFTPHAIQSGDYSFDVGTAGSVTLLLQCLIPALLFGKTKSTLTLTGGTDVPFAPPSYFLKDVFLEAISSMGANVLVKIVRHGFYPKGQGILYSRIEPIQTLQPFIPKKTNISYARIVSALLPNHVAEREKQVITRYHPDMNVEVKNVKAASPGNAVFIRDGQNGFSTIGKIGMPAEAVAQEALQSWKAFTQKRINIDTHLADQLILYAALANHSSEFSTEPSAHVTTNADMVQRLLKASTTIQGKNIRITGKCWKNNNKIETKIE